MWRLTVTCAGPTDTGRKDNVIMTSKRRRFDAVMRLLRSVVFGRVRHCVTYIVWLLSGVTRFPTVSVEPTCCCCVLAWTSVLCLRLLMGSTRCRARIVMNSCSVCQFRLVICLNLLTSLTRRPEASVQNICSSCMPVRTCTLRLFSGVARYPAAIVRNTCSACMCGPVLCMRLSRWCDNIWGLRCSYLRQG